MPDTPTIGHNSGLDPLLDPELLQLQWGMDHAPLLKRQTELTEGMARFRAAFPNGIADDEAQGKAAEFVAQLKACAKEAERIHGVVKAPYLACGRAADAYFKRIGDGLVAMARDIEGMQTAYARAKIEAERKRRQEEADRLAREAREAAEAARRQQEEDAKKATPPARQIGTMFGIPVSPDPNTVAAEPPPPPVNNQVMETAEIASARAAEAQRAANASDLELSRTRGSMGALASLRAKWEFRVTDITKVPAKYLMINESLVKAEVKALKDKTDIPGIEVFDASRVVSNAR
jgi:hypothetical protein